MIFLLLLLLRANADWQGIGYLSYDTADQAASECAALEGDYHLCTPAELVYAAYYDNVGICWSGFLDADTESHFSAGWFNNAENGGCGDGWNTWTSNGQYGAHCCSSDQGSINSFESCGVYSCEVGSIDTDLTLEPCFGMDGCTDADCGCADQSVTDTYVHVYGYDYFSGEEAESQCQATHADLHVCDVFQIEGAVENGGHNVCSSGWYIDADGEYTRGWYVSESWASNCQDISGWRTWQSGDGAGTIHCCTNTYAKSSWAGLAADPQLAANWCADNNDYATTLCRKSQLETISKYENTEICQSAWVENVDAEANIATNWGFAGYEVGWYQTDTSSCGGSTEGWNTYRADNPDAHCCVDWVLDSVTEIFEYVATPTFYAESSYADGATADADCINTGYTGGLCTMAQQAYTAENEDTYGASRNVVGWAKDEDGSYTTGFWNAGAWNTYSISSGSPLAHCCQSSVPELDGVYGGEIGDYGNSGHPYSFTNYADAEQHCTDEGYAKVCSRDQVEYAATVGVNDVIYNDICFQGYMDDESTGWYNGGNGCGSAGWNFFNTDTYGVHCCSDFDAPLSVPAFKTVGAYSYTSEAAALAGCQEENENYVLCSDNEVYAVATAGVTVPDELSGDYADVDAQTSLCFSAWTDSARSSLYLGGWYQVDDAGAGCGSPNSWGTYFPSETGAGAFCCISDAINAEDVFGNQDLPVFAVVGGRDFDSQDAASAACEAKDENYQLCSDNELYWIATEGATVDGVDGIAGVEAQTSICGPGWVDAERSTMYQSGWYQTDFTEGDWSCGGEGWNTWMDNGFGAAFCCLSDYISDEVYFVVATDNPTMAPTFITTTTTTTTTAEPTAAPTATPIWSELPSTINWDVTDYCLDYVPEGFEGTVQYCVTGDMVYVNGRSTCINAGDYDNDEGLQAVLEDSWENNWYLAASDDCGSKTYDEATQDQLWITNEMIDNLEADVNALEASLDVASGEIDSFVEDWKSDITSLIEQYISNFDAATQEDLNEFLDNL